MGNIVNILMKKSGKILKVGCLGVRRGRGLPIRGDTGGG
jgi:hypothetical protein